MLKPSQKPGTYDDIRALPEHVVGELIDGILHTQPRPAAPHAFAATGILGELYGPFMRGAGPGGWVILGEPELHLGPDVVVPDLAGWRAGRLSSAELKGAFLQTAPDWVAEIASPSTARTDRLLKMPLYARNGVDYLWLVDPLELYIEAFARDGSSWRFLGHWGDETEAKIPPFDAVPLDLNRLWQPTRG